MLPRGLELAQQAIHVVDVVVRPLAVLAVLVVARSAREIRRHVVAGNRAIRDAVAVHILVAAPAADPLQRLRVEHLAAIERPSGYSNVLDIQVFIARSRSLITNTSDWKPLGEIERVHRHRVALFDGRRDQHDLLGVAVRQQRRAQDVALRGAGRQTRRRSHALDVEDHAGNLRVVGQPGELAHQRDAGT